jgi:O-antigen/teichoic acid export membrane protein
MTSFIFWMLLASALGFIKLLGLAAVLSAQDYGNYVVCFGIAIFSSLLISFGLTEKTIKEYPRQWASGHRETILSDATRIAVILVFRFFIAGTACVMLSILGLIPQDYILVILATILGLSTALLSLVGSLYRAVGSQNATHNFTLLRSSANLGIALLAGSLLGWQGAVGGDIVANLIGVLFAVWQFSRLFKNTTDAELPAAFSKSTENGHYQIYLSNLAGAPQTTIDKAWVNSALGPLFAGSYGVITLIPQAAQLLVNVIVQHIGPLVIKLVHLKQDDSNQKNNIGFNAALLILFSIVVTVTALICKRVPYFDYLFSKFLITDTSLVLAGVIACGQFYSLIEFHLIARDRERDVLTASLVSGLIFITSFTAASATHVGVEWFLAGACLARWGQVWMLRRAYLRYV